MIVSFIFSLPSQSRRSGFSLIETVLALGIMGLAVTALLGLLPHGIQMSKKAADASAQSRIIDVISSKIAGMSFPNIQGLAPQKLYFDDQGVQLEAKDISLSTSYIARVTAYPGVTLPGGTSDEPYIVRAVVDIAATPNSNFNFDQAAPESYQTCPLLFGPINP